MTKRKKKSVVVWGASPDPRTSGISAIQDGVLAEVNKSGRDVYLITQDWKRLKDNPKALMLWRIPASHPYSWHELSPDTQHFDSLEDLVQRDAEGTLNGGKPLLAEVGIVHSHSDDFIPHYNEWERNGNNYQTLIDHIQKVGKSKPKLVRTRHDNMHAGMDRLGRLTGLDWEGMPETLREAYLEDGRRIVPVVEQHIRINRQRLKEEYGMSDEYLDHAIGHVWHILHQLRLWRTETADLDRIVTLTENGREAVLTFGAIKEAEDARKVVAIYNGTSFKPSDMARIDGLLEGYHTRGELYCYRGGGQEKEPIPFQRDDKKVIFVGRQSPDKGTLELVRSLAQLYKEGHTNIRGIFVGDFSEEDRREIEKIDPEHGKEYLLFTGKVSDQDTLASILAFGDVTAIPSHHDGFNLVASESLLMGTPIIVTDYSGIGDAYITRPHREGRTIAFPVSKRESTGFGKHFGIDNDSLTEQIRTAITDTELAWKRTVEGKRFVKEHYTSERMGREYAELFDRLLQEDESEKIDIAFFCTTTENTHGVPVVMNNIASVLARNPQYRVSFITNNFDDNTIEFIDPDGKRQSFRNRTEFAQYAERIGLKIDILHTHSWHMGDYYLPFHTARDSMDIATFLHRIGQPKVVYTDHSNPTEDERRLRIQHGIDYKGLSGEGKGAFLYANVLDRHHRRDWVKGWEASSILSRRQIMNLADIVTFVSETQLREEETIIPYFCFRNKSRVVMNGIDIGKYNTPETRDMAREIRKELEISPEEKVVLYAGRLDPEKGIYELAQAARIMLDHGERVTLVYLGGSGEASENETKDLLRRYADQVKVLFPRKVGRKERHRMAAMYAMADVVAQPTWGECFNQTVAEALAMGTPAVVSDYSATGEIYVQSGAAIGCKVNDPTDLANKLNLALNDERLRMDTTAKGQALVRDRLNTEAMVRQYMEIYQHLA